MYSVDQPPDTVGKTSKHDKDVKYDDADYMRVCLPDPLSQLAVLLLLKTPCSACTMLAAPLHLNYTV